jgi:chromosome segregation ATPase
MLDVLKELQLQEQVSSQEEIASLNNDIRNARQSISEKDCIMTQIEGKMSLLSQANLEDEQCNKDISNERAQLEYRITPFEEDVKLKEAKLAHLIEQIKRNLNTLRHQKVELDSSKIKANKQLASLVRVCSEKEGTIVSLENKLVTGSDSTLNCIDNHHALKLRLRSIAEEFLSNKEQRHSMARSNHEMLESIENKVSLLQKAIEQKQTTHS